MVNIQLCDTLSNLRSREAPWCYANQRELIQLFRGCMVVLFVLFLFCFGQAHSMQKFLGQGSNLSHSNDNTKPLTTRPPGNSIQLYLE